MPDEAAQIRHTIVVRPSASYCGNCDANVLPGRQSQCPACETPFTYSATNTMGDKPLDEYAAQFQRMWPSLEFIGIATTSDDFREGQPRWQLYKQWP